jgi:hypothetical protein
VTLAGSYAPQLGASTDFAAELEAIMQRVGGRWAAYAPLQRRLFIEKQAGSLSSAFALEQIVARAGSAWIDQCVRC